MLDDSLGFPYYQLINIGRLPSLKIKQIRDPSLKIKKGIPSPENRKVSRNPFHVFDRDEIHIQTFLYILWMENLSFPGPHLHHNIFKICIHVFIKFKKMDTYGT